MVTTNCICSKPAWEPTGIRPVHTNYTENWTHSDLQRALTPICFLFQLFSRNPLATKITNCLPHKRMWRTFLPWNRVRDKYRQASYSEWILNLATTTPISHMYYTNRMTFEVSVSQISHKKTQKRKGAWCVHLTPLGLVFEPWGILLSIHATRTYNAQEQAKHTLAWCNRHTGDSSTRLQLVGSFSPYVYSLLLPIYYMAAKRRISSSYLPLFYHRNICVKNQLLNAGVSTCPIHLQSAVYPGRVIFSHEIRKCNRHTRQRKVQALANYSQTKNAAQNGIEHKSHVHIKSKEISDIISCRQQRKSP